MLSITLASKLKINHNTLLKNIKENITTPYTTIRKKIVATDYDWGRGYADGTSADGTGLPSFSMDIIELNIEQAERVLVFLSNSAEGKIAKHTLIDIFNLFKKLLLTLTTNRLKLTDDMKIKETNAR